MFMAVVSNHRQQKNVRIFFAFIFEWIFYEHSIHRRNDACFVSWCIWCNDLKGVKWVHFCYVLFRLETVHCNRQPKNIWHKVYISLPFAYVVHLMGQLTWPWKTNQKEKFQMISKFSLSKRVRKKTRDKQQENNRIKMKNSKLYWFARSVCWHQILICIRIANVFDDAGSWYQWKRLAHSHNNQRYSWCFFLLFLLVWFDTIVKWWKMIAHNSRTNSFRVHKILCCSLFAVRRWRWKKKKRRSKIGPLLLWNECTMCIQYGHKCNLTCSTNRF